MADHAHTKISGSAVIVTAAVVVIVAGLRAAQPIVVPFIVACFLAVICLPALKWLKDKGLPTALALLAITAVIVVIGLVIMGVIGGSISQLREELPNYERRVGELQDQLSTWLKDHKIDPGFKIRQEDFDAQRAVSLFGTLLSALGSLLGNALVIIFTLVFMLLEAADFPAKLRAIAPDSDAFTERLGKIQASIRQYVTIKTRVSFLGAVLITVWLWFLGVDFALFWGLLAFLLNFIPNIGTFIAAAPAVAVAFLQLNLGTAVAAAAGYLVVDFGLGNMLEPRLMGRGLGLSTLVVFLSLVFWGWVLGPVGMLFAVPLTMIVKIALANTDNLKWIAILLSSDAAEFQPPRPARKKSA